MIKIVIFDDNAELLRVMQLCLGHYGIDVKGATGKKHFYQLLDTFEPDVLVIDVNLGAEDGRIICRTLSEDAKYAHFPVVLFSASADKLDDYKTYGADGRFEKPFKLKDISSIMLSAIENRRAAMA
jgi:CheY-like chemotaxis protein